MAQRSSGNSGTIAGFSPGRFAWGLFALAVVLAVWGIGSRLAARAALGKETAESAVPTVFTVRPTRDDAQQELVLPGNVEAHAQASIFARVSGYLKSWDTDIGTHVTQGQRLALIDTPEVDQELKQAEADLATAIATSALADATNARWQRLVKTGSVSKQAADEKAGDAAAKKALVDSAQANVGRLRQLESFKEVTAPFDGVVTLRNTDIGNLINAGQGQGAELFRVADTHTLRVYVQVPQAYAASIVPGLEAELKFADHPGKSYAAKIERTANALDPVSRTLQVELGVDNGAGELLPGSYAEVHFKIPGEMNSLKLPATAFIFRSDGLEVAVVGPSHHVALKPVTPGRDFGSEIEVLAGIAPGDDVVLDPPDSLADGAEVRLSEHQTTAGKEAAVQP